MICLLMYSEDPKLRPLLTSALRSDYNVIVESDPEEVKHLVNSGRADVLILDFDSNFGSLDRQLQFYDELGDCPVPVVVMTDDVRRSTALELLQRGAYDYIRKLPSLVELKIVVRRAYEHAQLKKELDQVRDTMRTASSCDQLLGSSGRSQIVYDLIRRVANLGAYVLITGESGTGKELVARAIHNLSNRACQPFVAVSCGAIPETLIESELFGHEKGAFTGANAARSGLMERAGEGTLLLDEIGELSLATQVKLLRVLQEKAFSRLGSNRLIPLKARVLFATHRNLENMVDQGTFRRDLFYRVNVVRINVPSLRERTEDIPLLARHFLQKYADAYEKPVTDIRPNAMELLVDYSWPGNVRELENVIQNAVILADGDNIGQAELPERIQQLAPETPVVSDSGESFEERLRSYKIELANRAISECNGNKTLAARKLRVSRAYLHRLIRMPEAMGVA